MKLLEVIQVTRRCTCPKRVHINSNYGGFWRTVADSKENAQSLTEWAFALFLLVFPARLKIDFIGPPDRRDNQASLRPDAVEYGISVLLTNASSLS
jgi:hypothetical protein